MPDITNVIEKLSYFSGPNGIGEINEALVVFNTLWHNETISKKKSKVLSFYRQSSEPITITDQRFQLTREALTRLSSYKQHKFIVQNNIYLVDACYEALLVLAEFNPINPKDQINPEARLYTSTGHVFDIHALIAYHNTRVPIDAIDDKSSYYKRLINPYTNQPFSYCDSTHIRASAKQQNIYVTASFNGATDNVNLLVLSERLKEFFARTSTDELADDFAYFLNNMFSLIPHTATVKNAANLATGLVIFYGFNVIFCGHGADQLIKNTLQTRVGFSEAGTVIGSGIIILALVARLMLEIKTKSAQIEQGIQHRVKITFEQAIPTISSQLGHQNQAPDPTSPQF